MHPTAAIGGIIYVGGASDFVGGLVTDNTTSFSFNPGTNTIGAITAIPRATGETRALNFNGKMLVMGGGRVAPNPSNQVDIYDPGTNAWTTGSPVPAFITARRNFATDTDGTSRIWLAGGYAPTAATELDGDLLRRRRCAGAEQRCLSEGSRRDPLRCQSAFGSHRWSCRDRMPHWRSGGCASGGDNLCQSRHGEAVWR